MTYSLLLSYDKEHRNIDCYKSIHRPMKYIISIKLGDSYLNINGTDIPIVTYVNCIYI